MEKLYELHHDERFDVIVVDTPPTRNALDFLEAPGRLTRFLDHRLYKLLITPTRGLARAMNVAAQAFLRTVSRVIGREVVTDLVEFFTAFDGMEQGFKDRAAKVVELLSAPETAFVLVTAPRRDVVEEASFFAEKLDEAGIPVRALIVNRVHPHFTAERPAAVAARAEEHAGTALGELYANLADFASVAVHGGRPPGRALRAGGAGPGREGAVPGERRARRRRPGPDRRAPLRRTALSHRRRSSPDGVSRRDRAAQLRRPPPSR